MPKKVDQVVEQALALPIEARARLADRLVESLDPAEDSYLHRIWAAEAQRRLAELRAGAVRGIPGQKVMARLRKKYSG